MIGAKFSSQFEQGDLVILSNLDWKGSSPDGFIAIDWGSSPSKNFLVLSSIEEGNNYDPFSKRHFKLTDL